MEKSLPYTAVFIESIAIGFATIVLVQDSINLAALLVPLAIVVIVSLFIQKDLRIIGLGFLASVALTLNSSRPSIISETIMYALVFFCGLEISINIANAIIGHSNKHPNPVFVNGGFAFFGVLLGIIYRVTTCHVAADNPISRLILLIFIPVCEMLTQGKYTVGGVIFDLLTYFPIVASISAGFYESVRFPSNFS